MSDEVHERTVQVTDQITSRADIVEKQILAEILLGHYQSGERLPTERQLAQHFHSSRDTIRQVLSELELMGIVTKRGTTGTYVEKGVPIPTPVPASASEPAPNTELQPRGTPRSVFRIFTEESAEGSVDSQRDRDESPNDRALCDFLTPRDGDTYRVLTAEPLVLVSTPPHVALELEVLRHTLVLRHYRMIERRRGRLRQRYSVESYYPEEPFIELLRKGLDERDLDRWLQRHYDPAVRRIEGWADIGGGTHRDKYRLRIPRGIDLSRVTERALDSERHVLELTYLLAPVGTVPWEFGYDVNGLAAAPLLAPLIRMSELRR